MYSHTIKIKEIPVPPKTIQVVITTNNGVHESKQEFYAEPDEFLQFWQPLVNYYEEVKHARASSNS